MIYFQNTIDFYMAGPTAVMLGKFDGVHKGHQKLLEKIGAYTKEHPGTASVAFVLSAREENKILTDEEQKDLFEQAGISCLVRCPFIPEIYTMSPEAFIEEVLVGKLHAAYITVGTDFRFGHNRAGSAQTLLDLADRYGYVTEIVDKEMWEGREISSTYIREALQEGNMELAANLMGRAFSVSGKVIHGRHLGTQMGMPTANLVPAQDKLLPPNGVYYSRTLLNGEEYEGITNIGCKPTVNGTFIGAETYLFHMDRPLYGEEIRVDLLHYKRPEHKFDSIESLKEQITSDIEDGKEYFRG